MRKELARTRPMPRRRLRSLVVAADSGIARILRRPRPGAAALEEIARLERDTAGEPARALTTDLTGRLAAGRSRVEWGGKVGARHGAGSDYDPHVAEIARFARRLVRRLEAERRRAEVDELVLIAAPQFLGALRPQLTEALRELLVREVDKDLAQADPSRIYRTAFPDLRPTRRRSRSARKEAGR